MTLKPVCIALADDDRDRLDALARARDRTRSWLARQAIAHLLKNPGAVLEGKRAK